MKNVNNFTNDLLNCMDILTRWLTRWMDTTM